MIYAIGVTVYSFIGFLRCELGEGVPDQSDLVFGNTAFRHPYCQLNPNDD